LLVVVVSFTILHYEMSGLTDEKANAADVRKLGVYRDDLTKWERAARASQRSRAGLMKFVVNEWAAGRAVYVPIPAPLKFKRQTKAGGSR